MKVLQLSISEKISRINKKRRKNRNRLLQLAVLLALVCLFILPLSAMRVRAAANVDAAAMEELNGAIDDLLASLDTSELDAYLNTLTEFHGITLKDKLKSVITGDYRFDYATLGEAVLAFVLSEAKGFLPAFAIVLAVSLLCGVLNSAKNGFLHSTMPDIISFVGYISVGAVVLACLLDVIDVGFIAVRGMKKQMEIVFPILLTLMAASGGSASVAVYRPAVAFMSGAVCDLFSSVVMPMAIIVIVLAFLGNLSGDVRTEKLGDLFKSGAKWITGLALGIFSLFLTVQGISSAQYDGMSLHAIKYVVSGSVPVVGGFLSGGVDVVVAGSALIKNALGSFCIFLMTATVLRCVLIFAVFQLFLRVSSAATEPASGKISVFLSRLAGDCGYFLAGELSVGFLYFLTLLLLVLSTGVIVS